MLNISTPEATLYEKTRWLSGEMLTLSRQFNEATVKLETSRVEASLPGMRSAYLDIQKIADQSAALTGSLLIALTNEDSRRSRQ